jgi:nucleotide-binding universal stress UspA family protein
MRKLGSIVVGIDFSDSSCVALAHAARIARWSGAALHAVHIVETGDHPNPAATLTPLQQQIRAGLQDEARRHWSGFVRGVVDADELPLHVSFGSRFGGIHQFALDRGADLLVLGAVGHARPNVGLGTLASGCIRSVPADVLVVRDDFQGPFRTVVVGVDFSETSRRALEAGAMLAAREAAILRVVFVVPDAHGTAMLPSRDVDQELEIFTRAATDAWPDLEARCDVYPHTGHRSGILEFATAVHGDVVVVGTRGRTNLRDVVLGSTAEKVLRDSLVAVWACKPAALLDRDQHVRL